MIRRFLLAVVTLLIVVGCQETKEKFGFADKSEMDSSTPEGAAMLFFTGLYQKDARLGEALVLSSPKLQRLLRSYHSPRSVQRHILNLTYDDIPNMEVDARDFVGRAQYKSNALVSIFFEGFSHGDKINETRSVEMIKIGKTWKVDVIKPDKFL